MIQHPIWTPQLLEVLETALLSIVGVVEEPVACEVVWLTTVLGGIREAVDKEGSVVDRLRVTGV
jgi:hypothetical protein